VNAGPRERARARGRSWAGSTEDHPAPARSRSSWPDSRPAGRTPAAHIFTSSQRRRHASHPPLALVLKSRARLRIVL
jgi:hypothetical protein